MNHSLSGKNLGLDPIRLFRIWFQLAEKRTSNLPNAMCLSTVSKTGRPSARMVLLKDFDEAGFVFYTSLKSQKSKEIEGNPHVALTFYWKELDRQIRIEGRSKKISTEEADRYFSSRPREYQISAWASKQSELLGRRQTLLNRYREFEKRFRGKDVPRPPHWLGFNVSPTRIEFWENRANRLHDRVLFSRKVKSGIWKSVRLYP